MCYLRPQHWDDIKKLYTGYDDIVLLIEMGYEENDESMVREIRSEIQEFEKSFEELRIQTLFYLHAF